MGIEARPSHRVLVAALAAEADGAIIPARVWLESGSLVFEHQGIEASLDVRDRWGREGTKAFVSAGLTPDDVLGVAADAFDDGLEGNLALVTTGTLVGERLVVAGIGIEERSGSAFLEELLDSLDTVLGVADAVAVGATEAVVGVFVQLLVDGGEDS